MATATANKKVATTFIPLYDRILVRREEAADMYKNAIYIPDNAKDKPMQGLVVAAGPGREKPLQSKEGDTVLFGQYSGTEIKIDGETLLIMREEEILGILKFAGK